MSTVEQRLMVWVIAIGELLVQPLTEFPRREIRTLLEGSFDAEASWNVVRPDGTFEMELEHPRDGWPAPADIAYLREEGMARNPLNRWYAATGSISPQTISRVPATIADASDQAITRELLVDVGLEQNMCLPHRVGQAEIAMFMVGRSGSDFSDDDLDLARRVQPLILLLDRQVVELGRRPQCTYTDVTLTARENAILNLLADGLTAETIARRLGSSTRTVRKHLEHIYRKLDAHDRLTAVRRAEAVGILRPLATPAP